MSVTNTTWKVNSKMHYLVDLNSLRLNVSPVVIADNNMYPLRPMKFSELQMFAKKKGLRHPGSFTHLSIKVEHRRVLWKKHFRFLSVSTGPFSRSFS